MHSKFRQLNLRHKSVVFKILKNMISNLKENIFARDGIYIFKIDFNTDTKCLRNFSSVEAFSSISNTG